MASTSASAALPEDRRGEPEQWLVIGASSLGTVFEWYDFYLYGLLASIFSAQFFSGVNEITGFIFALAAFAAGFAVRPFGALVFGRLGDLVGRKHTFLITMSIMGGVDVCGRLAAELRQRRRRWRRSCCWLLRLLQGLALGGEYGGAATYVAENSPQGKRGLFTSFIQTTATLGLFAALLVVIGTRTAGRRGCVQGVGLAHTVPGLRRAAGGFAVDSHAAGREPGVPQDEEPGHHVEGAAVGGLRRAGAI